MSPILTRFRSVIIASVTLGASGAVILRKSISSTPFCDKWDDNWDRREPTCVEDDDKIIKTNTCRPRPKAVRTLFLIRHGQFQAGEEGDQNRILTELGRNQALMTGERLAQLGYPYSLVVSSTMSRAKETASLIASRLQGVFIKECSVIEEGVPTLPEPLTGRFRQGPKEFEYFQDGPRIESGFRKYFHRADPAQDKDSYEIIVCHANVIRYFVCRALQLPAHSWHRFSINHASITRINILPSGRVRLVLGESGHLPPDKITTKNGP